MKIMDIMDMYWKEVELAEIRKLNGEPEITVSAIDTLQLGESILFHESLKKVMPDVDIRPEANRRRMKERGIL